jgi:hypothetical protein
VITATHADDLRLEDVKGARLELLVRSHVRAEYWKPATFPIVGSLEEFNVDSHLILTSTRLASSVNEGRTFSRNVLFGQNTVFAKEKA